VRRLLAEELRRSEQELGKPRSGYDAPVTVAVGAAGDHLIAVVPVDASVRADPEAASERAWLLAAAAVGALAEASDLTAPTAPGDLAVEAGALDARLALRLPGGADPDLAVLAFEEQIAGVDRLRARALALPGHVLADAGDWRAPIGPGHPLHVAEAVARFGGRPADPRSVEELEDAVLGVLEPADAAVRPHDDPDPGRRVARRILQRLDGMGKWGGYHTEFAHLARGFHGNDQALAGAVGERLLAAGLLAEKPSVGQRHVYLNPRRVGDIRAMIDRGEVPAGLDLPQTD
jgi:hypothetical protein